MTARLRLTAVAAMATLLGALALSAVFNDGAWVGPVVLSILVSAGCCALGRRVGVPRPIVPLVGIAGLTLLVTRLYGRTDAVWGFLPGPGAIKDLNQVLVVAIKDVQRFASPAPTEQALLLLAVLGVGGAAIAVDTLAVTCRSAALAGAPLLALYAVPASLSRGGVSWVLFAASAIGWLALMLAEGRERLSGWGRALGRRSSRGDGVFTGAPAEPLGVVGRRIGAAALGLAVILPAIMPIIGGGLFGGNGSGSGPGHGSGASSSVTTINPLVGIANDLGDRNDATVLTYTSNDPNPDYLRMITLDSFDGTNWNVAKLSPDGAWQNLDPTASKSVPGRTVTTQIAATNLRTTWLPAPYPVAKLGNLTGDWSYDAKTLDIFAHGNDTTQGRNYTVSSVHASLTADELRAAGSGHPASLSVYTQLPANLPAKIKATTDSLVKGLSSDYDKALAIQQFFLDPANKFTYTTDIPAFTGSPLLAFLANRKGFCQQFATMYAVMARQAGLPTRINVGFTAGYQTKAGSELWTVGRQNAHAWPEVYFRGLGWVRFEPTPGPSGVETPSYAPAPGAAGGPGSPTTPLPASQSAHNGARDDLDIGTDNTKAQAATSKTAGTKVHWSVYAGIVAGLVLLVSPGVARVVRRRRRLRPHLRGGLSDPSRRILEAWRELSDTGRDIGLPWAPSRTSRRIAEALVAYGVRGDAAVAARRLARAVERVRYAPYGVGELGDFDPGADARLVAKAMEAASPAKIRWRARLLPASVLAVAGGALADVLDWVDGLGARLRAQLGRLLPDRLVGRST
jgi:transglutaminase-like putative cysteine protease